jgi:hypothetical protein
MPQIQTVRSPSDATVLNHFFDSISLYKHDARALEKAFGWNALACQWFKMRSAPNFFNRLFACAALTERFGDRLAWPAGFYVEPTCTSVEDELSDFGELPAESLKFNSPRHGLLVRVCRVVTRGIQVYRHPKDDRPRWITSADLSGGRSQTASIHVQGSLVGKQTGKAVLVANSLEAYAVAHRYRQCAVALNGVSLRTLPAQLFEALPTLRGLVVAMKEPPPRLSEELSGMGIAVNFFKGGDLL